MSSVETLEKRTVSALSYLGLYKLHLANLYLSYAQTQPWTLNKSELHDVARSIIPTLSWKLDGTPIITAAHYRLAYSIIKDDPFIADADKQIIYDAWPQHHRNHRPHERSPRRAPQRLRHVGSARRPILHRPAHAPHRRIPQLDAHTRRATLAEMGVGTLRNHQHPVTHTTRGERVALAGRLVDHQPHPRAADGCLLRRVLHPRVHRPIRPPPSHRPRTRGPPHLRRQSHAPSQR